MCCLDCLFVCTLPLIHGQKCLSLGWNVLLARKNIRGDECGVCIASLQRKQSASMLYICWGRRSISGFAQSAVVLIWGTNNHPSKTLLDCRHTAIAVWTYSHKISQPLDLLPLAVECWEWSSSWTSIPGVLDQFYDSIRLCCQLRPSIISSLCLSLPLLSAVFPVINMSSNALLSFIKKVLLSSAFFTTVIIGCFGLPEYLQHSFGSLHQCCLQVLISFCFSTFFLFFNIQCHTLGQVRNDMYHSF